MARVGRWCSTGAMQDDAGEIDSSDEDGASDFRASKWLRARPRVVPEDALILTSSAALAAALAAYEADRATGRQDTAAYTSAQAWDDYGRKVPGINERGFKQAYNTKVRRSRQASATQSASTPGTGLRSGNGERHFDTAAKAKAMAQTDKLHQTDTLGLLHGTPKPAPFKWAPPPYKAGESPSKYKSYSKSWRSHARVQHGLDGREATKFQLGNYKGKAKKPPPETSQEAKFIDAMHKAGATIHPKKKQKRRGALFHEHAAYQKAFAFVAQKWDQV